MGRVDKLSLHGSGADSLRWRHHHKGLKETEARPGEWVVISGWSGLGHVTNPVREAMGRARRSR